MIDSHAHLNDPHYDEILPQVVARAKQAGVIGIINVGYDIASSRKAIDLADEYECMYAAIGVHPHHAQDVTEPDLETIRQMAVHPKVLAIGEIGLDYFYDNSPRLRQQEVFRQQIKLAEELGLPVVIHSREAAKDTLDIVQEHANSRCLFHCYSGSLEFAKIYLDMGHYISFAGPITFNNANRLRQVAANIPLERLLIETDCPYLAPVPNRGRTNEPAWVKYVAEKLAELHGISYEEMKKITVSNTEAFFDKKFLQNKVD